MMVGEQGSAGEPCQMVPAEIPSVMHDAEPQTTQQVSTPDRVQIDGTATKEAQVEDNHCEPNSTDSNDCQQIDAITEAEIPYRPVSSTLSKTDNEAESVFKQKQDLDSVSHSKGENDNLEQFHSICQQIASGDTCLSGDSILPLVLSEDMSSIKDFKVLQTLFVRYLHILPSKIISGVLSIIIATVKKSIFHLEQSKGLLIPSLDHLISNSLEVTHDKPSRSDLEDSSSSSMSLTKHFLCEWINLLVAHSCDVEELKTIIAMSEKNPSLLNFVQQANIKQRNRPSAFFAFPGSRGSMMSLPPFQKWPVQSGWSFSTWFLLEPKACAQPYLFNFKTGRSGLGYSAHFTANCLVLTSIRVKGKGVQHCVSYEFPSHKWTHCAITYHSKWRTSEIRVYVNGQLLPAIEIPWQVQTSEIFDKCFIGGSEYISSSNRASELNSFCGQMSAIYLFNEGLNASQICAIHRLGPSYMGQFKYSNESHVNLPPKICKSLYEEKLSSSIFCLFSPLAVDSGTLCIQLAPLRSSTSSPAQNYFLSAPHAALLGQTKAIITQPVCSTIQSIGCSRSLLPLLDNFATRGCSQACASVVGLLCDLLESSPHWFTNEIIQNNGFVIIACSLAKNPKQLLTEPLLEILLNLSRSLLTTSNAIGDLILLKQLVDNLLFNPNLWIYADVSLQLKLYSYLANEFLHGARRNTNGSNAPFATGNATLGFNQPSSGPSAVSASKGFPSASSAESLSSCIAADMLFSEVRRVSTILQSLHALKYYYWVVEEKSINFKASDRSMRPSDGEIVAVRRQILLFTRELIVRSNSIPLDETQGILNYISTCTRSENLLDVIDMLASILHDHPESMVPAMDQKQAIRVIYSLISYDDERIRVRAIKLLTLFLSKCTQKRKQDIMGPNNLFMLLRDKLRVHLPLTSEVYEALLELMLESVRYCDQGILEQQSSTTNSGAEVRHNLKKKRIENSIIIKVVASLLRDEYTCHRLKDEEHVNRRTNQVNIKSKFINDLWNLIINSRENRRIILQMSVWQHWLINLIGSTITDSQLERDQVLAIFRVLLHHATRYEFGGWRVWIDTLAIIHTKVSLDEFLYEQSNSVAITDGRSQDSSGATFMSELASAGNESSRIEHEARERQQISESGSVVDHEPVDIEGEQPKSPIVSSISDRISKEENVQVNGNEPMIASAIDEVDSRDSGALEQMSEVDLLANDESGVRDTSPESHATNVDQTLSKGESLDSVDVAPSRSFRKSNTNEIKPLDPASDPVPPASLPDTVTSISVEKQSVAIEKANEDKKSDKVGSNGTSDRDGASKPHQQQPQRATASPAFRIPEFKWNSILIKLLNDLMFSIECDLYNWRCSGNCMSFDKPPFIPRFVSACSNSSSTSSSTTSSSTAATLFFENILQRSENQVYLVNIIHFVSQLSDNIIVAAGGLLPLLADATGGTRNVSSPTDVSKQLEPTEGLMPQQANSLLYRLTNIIDVAVFAASHINLAELEAEKNTTNGGILRQCLRLACTVTVKNCLVIRSLSAKNSTITDDKTATSVEFPRDFYDSYHGCSLLSVNNLFVKSPALDSSDLVANIEYSSHQTPNSGTLPSLLPFQSNPIKDPSKLMQTIDAHRIQACIYHTMSLDSRESQFLALSSLYFISVLMVSRYRDIIEPKNHIKKAKQDDTAESQNKLSLAINDESKKSSTLSNVESNLLSFGRMQPTPTDSSNASDINSLTDMLTKKLENTLDIVCLLLKSIMCDFCGFLSKTLIGSHGQDLVNREADRAFRCSTTSPVELVMLLCSQEWQNTLQKNAGLAFIELINEGRVSSIGMKEHIVRVAMEAEFILSRLRADDVAKHEAFSHAVAESIASRLHEENLINSLISSALRRDFAMFHKFQDSVKSGSPRHYKLDIWEDDDRRRRRFVVDSCSSKLQHFYSTRSEQQGLTSSNLLDKTEETKMILELQETIEMSGIDDPCSAFASAYKYQSENQDDQSVSRNCDDKDFECDEEEFEDDEDDDHGQNGSNSPDSELGRTDGQYKSSRDGEQDLDNSLRAANRLINPRSASQRGMKEDSFAKSQSGIQGHQAFMGIDDANPINEFTGSVVFAAECSLIWSIYAIPGLIQITNDEVHFEPSQNIIEIIDDYKRNPCDDNIEPWLEDMHHNRNNNRSKTQQPTSHDLGQATLRPVDVKVLCYCDFLTCNGKISLNDIRAIFSRHYLLQPHALEIFVAQRTSVMFAFADFDAVKRAVKALPPVGVGIKYGIPQSRRSSLMSARQLFASSNMTQKWQRREIGNYQYLTFLNTIAGRTYQDLNQYPVFPWILTNYESEDLDLNLPSNFRDLSKPVGALNSERRNEFIERYQSWENPKIPAFHYGTHYSTAAFTLNWLCRLRGGSNSAYLALHDGKYEDCSRLFMSVSDSWVGSLAGGQQNVKELIPEFFYLPEMFRSNMGLPDVELPPWAKSPEHFIRLHRLALESELVSCQLHQWIDLIFGYKQRGTEAINAVNTFYYLTYQGNVNLNMIQDVSLREAIATQIKHFGQTPSQLTTEPHPPRFSALHVSPLMFSPTSDELNKVIKLPFNTSVVHIAPCADAYLKAMAHEIQGSSTGTIPNMNNPHCASSILTVTSNNQYQIHGWNPNDQSGFPFTLDAHLEQNSSSRRQLVDIDDLSSSVSLKLLCYSSSSQLSDGSKQDVEWPKAHFVSTLDGRFLIMGSFYDNSFRVFSTSNGKLCQVIYGHRAPITCMARSEGNANADFYLATGSQDCSLLLWTWNERYVQIEGSGVSAVHNPLPKLTISGHQTPVLSALICAELGLIISGSENLILVHTTTCGENLLKIDVNLPHLFERASLSLGKAQKNTSECYITRPQVKDKEKTLLEASMLGQPRETDKVDRTASPTFSQNSSARDLICEKFSRLQELTRGDYYITNLQLARELAFIVCIALPPPNRVDRRIKSETSLECKPSPLLMTFNLKGDLIECTTIGKSINGPRLGDVCILQVTRDGEHLVLNDSPTSLKVLRTFDLQPIYAYNTNDIQIEPSEEQNRVKSLAMVDYKFILVGLDNGKILVYHADFRKA